MKKKIKIIILLLLNNINCLFINHFQNNKFINKKKLIIYNRYINSNKYLINDKYLLDKNQLQFNNSKINLISISPGGYLGLYMLGVSLYIRDNYDLKDYEIIGTSAGSWIKLLLLTETSTDILIKNIIIPIIKNISNHKLLNKNLLDNLFISFNNSKIKFNYNNGHIGLTEINFNKFNIINRKIINGNDCYNFEDYLNYCKCSSFIPILFGNNIYKEYNNTKYLDGGLSKSYEYYDNYNNLIFKIDPTMWGRKYNFLDGYYLNKNKIKKLFIDGYKDTYINRKNINLNKKNIFIRKINNIKIKILFKYFDDFI